MTQSSELAVSPASNDRPVKVLIADDDPGIQRFLAKKCAQIGLEAQTTSNGLNAVVLAGRIHPDVFILDINMPEVDGLAVCSRLLQAKNKPLGIIVITAAPGIEAAERCGSIGAHYVRKGAALWEGVHAALIKICPALARQGGQEMSSAPPVAWRLPRVLLVGGRREVGRLSSRRLAKLGVEPLLASDTAQGLKLALSEEPSVVILDFPTFEGDPYYFIAKLRSSPKTDKTPIFVASPRPLDQVTQANLRREILGRPGATHFFGDLWTSQEVFTALGQYCGFSTGSERNSLRS